MAQHRYGRGKFIAHERYIAYMESIVGHANYEGMPGARSPAGRITWQVSSGKTTSFYKYYVARREWWMRKADSLGLPGSGSDAQRFSTAARLIHPTGYRACRLCGEDYNVGYYYLNALLAKRCCKISRSDAFERSLPIDVAVEILRNSLGISEADGLITNWFPERASAFDRFGIGQKAFEETNHLRSRLLSPGFMCNPPDRLDGFHDYCLNCRGQNDPGRSPDNLRTYSHDRRAFEWWAEGNWAVADSLYNSAGPGKCEICGADINKVSPDHIGPLSCGFKQLPLFRPTCTNCNSSKNRRMHLSDVGTLLEYEIASGESTASFQVRDIWETYKSSISSDADATRLSSHMRAVQDFYLRLLYALFEAGESRFLVTLLRPEFAYDTIEFANLDPSQLSFDSFKITKTTGSLRDSLAARSIRIAFESLGEYVRKEIGGRKFTSTYYNKHSDNIGELVLYASALPKDGSEGIWDKALKSTDTNELKQKTILSLYKKGLTSTRAVDILLLKRIKELMAEIVKDTELKL